ncbi:MAG: hypothetical protein AB1540_16650 [Bdellovibrionota bacterium]
MKKTGLEVVTIDNFYENLQNPLAQELFTGLLLLRAEGYGPDYPKSFLPYDVVDFVAIHHLFCIRENQKLTPVGAFRQMLLSRADFYKLTLPIYKLAKESRSEPHILAVEKLIKSHRGAKTDLLYSSSFTIKKTLRGERHLTDTIKELVPALTLHDLKTHNIGSTLGGSALRFKTDSLFEKWGYSPIQWNGVPLPPVKKVSAENELVLIMHFEKMKPYAEECLNKQRSLIENRILISTALPEKAAA